MKHTSTLLVAGLIALATSLFTGCSTRPDLSGSYTTVFDAKTARGSGWHGSAEILLTQVGSSLTGNLTLHHPDAGTFQIPITSGTIQNGRVVFFGHATLPMGTVDLTFRGVVKRDRIEGGANVALQCWFGEEEDKATLQMAKV